MASNPKPVRQALARLRGRIKKRIARTLAPYNDRLMTPALHDEIVGKVLRLFPHPRVQVRGLVVGPEGINVRLRVAL